MAANTQQSGFHSFNNSLESESRCAMRRVLLVDNQAHVLRVMKLSLGRKGFEVDTALSANDALRLLRETQYDSVIVDNSLTDMNGQQFVDTVVEQFKEQTPALFLVTDDDAQALSDWSSSVDRIECLNKPISLHYVVGRLNEIFGTYDRALVD